MTRRRSKPVCRSFSRCPRGPAAADHLDLDATDDPLHGHQEEGFFHGYHDSYCYLPLYVFCGRHLLAAKLRAANIDASAGSIEQIARSVARIRQRWPKVRILLRADAGFAGEALMAWCESNGVDLTAIRSFFRFASFEEPAHSALIQQVLAIPSKRHDKRQLHFLARPEIEAILAAPDRTTWLGRRDYTLLLLVAQTGLRLSELIGLDKDAVHLGAGAHVRCVGKGRKERCTPLTSHAKEALRSTGSANCSRGTGTTKSPASPPDRALP